MDSSSDQCFTRVFLEKNPLITKDTIDVLVDNGYTDRALFLLLDVTTDVPTLPIPMAQKTALKKILTECQNMSRKSLDTTLRQKISQDLDETDVQLSNLMLTSLSESGARHHLQALPLLSIEPSPTPSLAAPSPAESTVSHVIPLVTTTTAITTVPTSASDRSSLTPPPIVKPPASPPQPSLSQNVSSVSSTTTTTTIGGTSFSSEPSTSRLSCEPSTSGQSSSSSAATVKQRLKPRMGPKSKMLAWNSAYPRFLESHKRQQKLARTPPKMCDQSVGTRYMLKSSLIGQEFAKTYADLYKTSTTTPPVDSQSTSKELTTDTVIKQEIIDGNTEFDNVLQTSPNTAINKMITQIKDIIKSDDSTQDTIIMSAQSEPNSAESNPDFNTETETEEEEVVAKTTDESIENVAKNEVSKKQKKMKGKRMRVSKDSTITAEGIHLYDCLFKGCDQKFANCEELRDHRLNHESAKKIIEEMTAKVRAKAKADAEAKAAEAAKATAENRAAAEAKARELASPERKVTRSMAQSSSSEREIVRSMGQSLSPDRKMSRFIDQSVSPDGKISRGMKASVSPDRRVTRSESQSVSPERKITRSMTRIESVSPDKKMTRSMALRARAPKTTIENLQNTVNSRSSRQESPKKTITQKDVTFSGNFASEMGVKRLDTVSTASESSEDLMPYKCDREDCTEVFAHKQDLAQHIYDRHSIQCEECGEKFQMVFKLNRHKERAHPPPSKSPTIRMKLRAKSSGDWYCDNDSATTTGDGQHSSPAPPVSSSAAAVGNACNTTSGEEPQYKCDFSDSSQENDKMIVDMNPQSVSGQELGIDLDTESSNEWDSNVDTDMEAELLRRRESVMGSDRESVIESLKESDKESLKESDCQSVTESLKESDKESLKGSDSQSVTESLKGWDKESISESDKDSVKVPDRESLNPRARKLMKGLDNELLQRSPVEFKCDDCGKRFKMAFAMNQHKDKCSQMRRMKSKGKKYVCEEQDCGKPFTIRKHLEVHQRIHSGETPYACQEVECGKRFTQMANLQAHQLIHTKEKPFTCGICSQSFPELSKLLDHKRSVHNDKEKRHKCPAVGCGEGFFQLATLNHHLKSKH
ncbi:unnamed protein product [Medioppia subpectinata]|uniref:C2H2-type domain-containing protein n=1 Tax=Medioppia subpectinata TaxID=1979941 RepID=A0A7R9PUW9_9ACAR|nr:unnamed protein product [Medioppia subpectinata]CAG2101232.1 unnamed protein product [Medioppia subpectinata]